MDYGVIKGVSFGLLAALTMGFFMAPRRRFGGNNRQFLLGGTAGAAAAGLAYWLSSGAPFRFTAMAWVPPLAGVCWMLGTLSYAAGAHSVGLAKASGIKNTHFIVTTAGGFLLFNEGASTNLFLASAGAALMLVMAFVLARMEHNDAELPHACAFGYIATLGSPLFYGINGLLLKWVIDAGLPRSQILFSMALGSLFASVCAWGGGSMAAGPAERLALRKYAPAVLSGLIWAAGFVAAIFSIQYIGVAVARTLQSLAIVVSFIYGGILLREIDLWRYRVQTAAVLMLTVLAVVCLYLSKMAG